MSGRTDDDDDSGCCDPDGACCCLCRLCDTCSYWTGLKCCCCHEFLGGHKDLLHIVHERHCTDVPCFLLIVLFLLTQLALFLTAIDYGDPRWLIYFADYKGNLCAPGESNGSLAAWPDIRIYDVVICVDDCNDTLTDSRIVTPNFDIDIDDVTYINGSVSVRIEGYETTNYFDAYCVPTVDSLTSIVSDSISDSYSEFVDTYDSTFDSLSETLSLALADIITCRFIFLACGVTALLVSLGWGWLIRYVGGIIVWGSILFTLLGVVAISYYLILYSETAYAFGWTTIGDIMYYGGIILAILDGMFFLAVCAMWHRIRLAIALAKETTRALNNVWGMIFYPMFPFLFLIIYIIYWVIGAVFMGSVVDTIEEEMPSGINISYYDNGPTLYETLGLSDPATYKYFEINQDWQYILLFHFFCLLWVIQFVSYHTYLVICGVYAEWYFAEWEDPHKGGFTNKIRGDEPTQLSPSPIWASLWRATTYHLGTIAFASLLIAIIEFLEYTLTYFEKRFTTDEPSPLQTVILAAIKCCLKCLKCIFDRINRNGLVITAVYGWPFCSASVKGIAIVFKNVIRSAALDMVSGYLEKLGKISIISFNTGVMMLITYYLYQDEISSLFLPTIIYLVISYAVCYQYMHLYEVGLQCIFICFLIDEEENAGNKDGYSHMRASDRLRKLIGERSAKGEKTQGSIAVSESHIKHIKSSTRINGLSVNFDQPEITSMMSGHADENGIDQQVHHNAGNGSIQLVNHSNNDL